MTSLQQLYSELDAWSLNDRQAQLWWRDDDAQSRSSALDQLLTLSETYRIPLSLAVIPDGLERSLIDDLSTTAYSNVLQHGYAHINYAAEGEKKQELGSHRPVSTICEELRSGFSTLQTCFAERFIPAIVPPWNRIHPDLFKPLVELGLTGLSTFKARDAAEPCPGLQVVNTHVDMIDWKGGKKFTGSDKVITQLTEHLYAKRTGSCDPCEPTGLLTHHLVHKGDSWEFLDRLFSALYEHPAVKWVGAKALFSQAAS